MASTDPLWLPSISFDETELRKMDSALLMADGTAVGSRPGIRPGDPGLAVSLAGTTVNVTAGTAALYRSGQGVYRAQMAATSPGTLAAANATFARIDLVYLRVWDTAVDSTGLRKADTVLLTGTPSGSPAIPTPGATEIYIPLATINVPNTGGGGTGAATVSSTIRQVTVAPGGILPVSSAADLAISGVYTGQTRFNVTRLLHEYWNGSAWVAQGDYSTHVPVWTAVTTNPTLGNGTLTSRWARVGGRAIHWWGALTIGSTTNPGSGIWFLSLPVAVANLGSNMIPRGIADFAVPGTNNYVGETTINPTDPGATFVVKSSVNAQGFGFVTNTFPLTPAAGYVLHWNITYEAAT